MTKKEFIKLVKNKQITQCDCNLSPLNNCTAIKYNDVYYTIDSLLKDRKGYSLDMIHLSIAIILLSHET